jgi:UDP-glucose 4-epimerase
VRQVVFSSTCATYGEPHRIRLTRHNPQEPTNPYGWSKLMMERILESYDLAYGLKFVALRYFNAAGATATRGEHHEPETHIIPNVLSAAQKIIPHVSVFGADYATEDGTAVRDYIHVIDLAEAHALALRHLRAGGASERYQSRQWAGLSVLEVIESARQVTGKQIEVQMEPRRAGDPSHLVADAAKARAVLGWQPRYPLLDDIIHTAWEWRLQHRRGYA